MGQFARATERLAHGRLEGQSQSGRRSNSSLHTIRFRACGSSGRAYSAWTKAPGLRRDPRNLLSFRSEFMARYRAAAIRLALQSPAGQSRCRFAADSHREERTSTGASSIAARLGPARQRCSNRAESSEAGTRRLKAHCWGATRSGRYARRCEWKDAIARAAVPGALRATTCPRWSENRGASRRPYAN